MKKSNVIIMWGVITGIILVLSYQILKYTNSENSGFKWANLVLMFLGLLIGTMQVRKANGGYLTFGEGFKAGFFMVLILTAFAIASTIIDLQTHPDFMEKILEQAKTNMINKGMTDDQIERGIEMTRRFTTPGWIITWVALFDLFFGAILSLITAGICSKAKPMFEDVTNNDIPQA